MNQLPVEPSISSNSQPESGQLSFNKMTLPMTKAINFAELQCASEGLIVVDTSHLFAGLLLVDEPSSNGLRLLSDLGLDVNALATSLKNSGFISGPETRPLSNAAQPAGANVSLAPEFRSLLKVSSSIAAGFNHEMTGTEHLLLAFLSTPETYGFRVFTGFGITLQAARDRFGQWIASGTYASEPASGSYRQNSLAIRISNPGLVYRIYQATRIGNMLLIFVPFAVSYFLSPAAAPSIYVYLGIMGPALYQYVFPYVISTYAVSYLLRTRIQKRLLDMPPSKSMVDLGIPFSLCVILGVFLVLTVFSMFGALIFSRKPVTVSEAQEAFAVTCGLLITLNSAATAVTHWLLTFNIYGAQFQFSRRP